MKLWTATLLVVFVSCPDRPVVGAPPCHVRNKVVVSAVPVVTHQVQVLRANVAGFYGVGSAAAAYQPQASSLDYQALLERFDRLEKLLANGAVRTAAVDPLRLVRSSCSKCHSGSAPKGDFSVDGELDEVDRLRAIEMILHDDPAKRMPKGATLDAQSIGNLIQELSRRPAGDTVRTSDTPPPPPTPEAQ